MMLLINNVQIKSPMRMKNHLRYFVLLSSFMISFVGFAQHNPNYCRDDRAIASREAGHLRHLHEHNKAAVEPQRFDIHYLQCKWEINPAISFIKGKIKTSFTILNAGTNQITLRLSDALDVTQILNGTGQNLSFSHTSSDELIIDLATILNSGDSSSVIIDYEGVPANTGFGSFIREEHNGTPIIWTLSEPFGSKDWWPSKIELNDKVDSVDIFITTPTSYRAASNGLLVNEISEGNQVTYHWQHRYPITSYLIALAVTNYQEFTHHAELQNGHILPILNYVFPENYNSAFNQTLEIVTMIEYFDSLIGIYPFHEEKYGHAEFNWGGGMEHQTMSFMGMFSIDLQAHELIHQWFGNKITCAGWDDIWLNEGFATYFTAQYQEFKGENQIWNNWKQGQANYITSFNDGSVYCTDTTNVYRIFSGRLSYAKGAYLLHMLRWLLGDEDFFQAIRNYAHDPELSFGYARTSDLRYHLETQSGINLSEFFADWFYGEGHPSYHINYGINNQELLIQIDQSQSHPSVSFFNMALPFRISGNGMDTLIRLNHEYSGQIFTIQLDFTPENVEFDPDHWILSASDQSVQINSAKESDSDLRIFPVPAESQLHLYTDLAIERIEITDLNGRIHLSHSYPVNNATTINIGSLAKGTWLIRFYSDQQVIVRKFVKI